MISDTTQGMNFGIHQGALVTTSTGEWWTILFVDSGPFGRFPSLQPVTWMDDWPMVGVDGKGVVTYRKPDVGQSYPIVELPTSDEFTDEQLGMQWGWNHNPDPDHWSLTEREGFLRIKTGRVVLNLKEAPNMLTQRPFANYNHSIPTIATTKLDVSQMKEGDIAGLTVFQDPFAFIAVKKAEDKTYIDMVNDGTIAATEVLEAKTVYLRSIASNSTKKAIFQYSLDNLNYRSLGNELEMRFNLKIFTGNKFGLFNYAGKQTGGHVDFDWFRVY
jgi:beta-xylosidase